MTCYRRLREKFEAETRELENSERRAVQKYNEIKVRVYCKVMINYINYNLFL